MTFKEACATRFPAAAAPPLPVKLQRIMVTCGELRRTGAGAFRGREEDELSKPGTGRVGGAREDAIQSSRMGPRRGAMAGDEEPAISQT